ncbi:hypothetical protein [Haloarchaeobius sp. DFWS5]|uniref:hypothetical protein n=1 Tax=Haloarchaeobius sp. DFWS5 TaxID=3446114 RepID=UPI003EBEAB13
MRHETIEGSREDVRAWCKDALEAFAPIRTYLDEKRRLRASTNALRAVDAVELTVKFTRTVDHVQLAIEATESSRTLSVPLVGGPTDDRLEAIEVGFLEHLHAAVDGRQGGDGPTEPRREKAVGSVASLRGVAVGGALLPWW